MRINKIHFKNFRSFEELLCPIPKKLGLIIGENDVGKTNIARGISKFIKAFSSQELSFNTFISIFNDDDFYQRDLSRDLEIGISISLDSEERSQLDSKIAYEKEKKQDFIPDKYRKTPYWDEPPDNYPDFPSQEEIIEGATDRNQSEYLKSKIEAYFSINIGELGINIDLSLYIPENYQDNFKRIVKERDISNIPSKELYNYKEKPFSLRYKSQCEELKYYKDSVISFLQRLFNENVKFLKDFRKKPLGIKSTAVFNETLDGESLPNVLYGMHMNINSDRNAIYDKIKETFSSIFPDTTFDVRMEEDIPIIQIKHIHSDFAQNINETGAGLFEVLFFLTNISRSINKVFILEEPELHLHPISQKKLLDIIERNTQKNQILIITHSPHFISPNMFPSLVRITHTHSKSTCAIFEIQKLVDLRQKRGVPSVSEDSTLARLARLTYGELVTGFFAKMVILCEGETEFLCLKEWAKYINYDFEANNIALVPAYGKMTMIDIAELYDSFGIPVFLIFDSDSDKTDKNQRKEHQKNNHWLASFAGTTMSTTDFIPPQHYGERYFIFDPKFEIVLEKNIDYPKIKKKVNKEFSLHKDGHKGIRAYYIAKDFAENSIRVPKTLQQLIDHIKKYRTSLD